MAATDSWPLVICDAGPLIHLDEIGCLDLLADFPAVLVPEQVQSEVARHRPAALTHPGAKLRFIPVALGFRTHGSLGVLLRSIRVGRRTKTSVLEVLHELPLRSTLHIKASLLQEIIQQVESLSES